MDNWLFAQNFFNTKCQELSIKDWSIRMNRTKRSMGQCKYSTREVFISSYLLESDQNNIRLTILHEIAHILTPGHNHEQIWKQVAVAIGGNSNVCCNYVLDIDYTWYLYCPTGCVTVGYFRKPKLNKQCKKCLSMLKLTQNQSI